MALSILLPSRGGMGSILKIVSRQLMMMPRCALPTSQMPIFWGRLVYSPYCIAFITQAHMIAMIRLAIGPAMAMSAR